jgi:hypothetical protein
MYSIQRFDYDFRVVGLDVSREEARAGLAKLVPVNPFVAAQQHPLTGSQFEVSKEVLQAAAKTKNATAAKEAAQQQH